MLVEVLIKHFLIVKEEHPLVSKKLSYFALRLTVAVASTLNQLHLNETSLTRIKVSINVHIVSIYAYKLLPKLFKIALATFSNFIESVLLDPFKAEFSSCAWVSGQARLRQKVLSLIVLTPRIGLKDQFTNRFVENGLRFIIKSSEGHCKIEALTVVKNLSFIEVTDHS